MTLPDINQVSEDYAADFLLAQLDRAIVGRDRAMVLLDRATAMLITLENERDDARKMFAAAEMLNTGLRAEMITRGLERDRANIALAKADAECAELRDLVDLLQERLDGEDT